MIRKTEIAEPGLTSRRRAVYDYLRSKKRPLTAFEVHSALPRLNLATVYRALQNLEGRRLAESFHLNCADHGAMRFWFDADAHRHYFHCTRCHQFTELEDCAAQNAVRRFEKRSRAVVTDHLLMLTGLCAGCKGSKKPDKARHV